jgi:hypothetical protein
MEKFCYLAILLISVNCADNEQYISQNHKTSKCGGFSSLKKVAMVTDSIDVSDYCSAEMLRWFYHSETSVIEFLLTRNLQNCAAKPEMNISKENDIYLFTIRDNRDPLVSADCMCYFDMYCELADQLARTIEIKHEKDVFTIDLNEGQGRVILDTATTWPCPDER